LAGLARFDEVWNGDGSQKADDRHDDHDFYQRKAGSLIGLGLHMSLRSWLLWSFETVADPLSNTKIKKGPRKTSGLCVER
jgi:hypothetical protein